MLSNKNIRMKKFPVFLFVGMDRVSFKMRKRFEDIDKILFPILPTGTEEVKNVKARDKRLGGIVDYIRLQTGFPVLKTPATRC